LFRQPAAHRLQLRHPRSITPLRSTPRTVAAHLVLPLAVDQATATAPDQIDPHGAFLCSSQYLVVVLRRPLESTQYASEAYRELLALMA
jgi:hypothetical protein